MSSRAAASSTPQAAASGGEVAAAALRQGIRALAADSSIEVMGRPYKALDRDIATLPAGTTAYVNALPDANHHDAVAVAVRLGRAGMLPVPHIAARRLASYTQLRDFVARLAGEAGVTQVLVIAGDQKRPLGPFDSSLQVLRTGLLQEHGIARVGVAGHPEGSPHIAGPALAAALAEKAALARECGLALYVASQFCFEAAPVLGWLSWLREQGHDVPVRVGLAGPASVKTLLKFALHCGVGPSIRGLGSHASTVARLLAEAGPERVIRALAEARPANLEGLHLFPFGGLARTAAWRGSLSAGRFRLLPGHEAFQVERAA